jgi:hypothetical protein
MDSQTLLLYAPDKYESLLVQNQPISLCPGRNDFQLLKDNIMQCSQKYSYQTYTTFHNTSIEHQVIDSEKSMPRTLYFAICKFLCSEIIFSKLPWHPPDGFSTSTFAMALIFAISLQSFQ